MFVGGVVNRSTDQAGHERDLAEIELTQLFPEKQLRAFRDAAHFIVADLAEVDLVEVTLKNLLFVEGSLEHRRQHELDDFFDRVFSLPLLEIFDELERDRAASLGERARAQIDPEGSEQPARIQAVVLHEVLVFDGDDRLPDQRRDIVVLVIVADGAPAFGPVLRERRHELGLKIKIRNLPAIDLDRMKQGVFFGSIKKKCDRLAARV